MNGARLALSVSAATVLMLATAGSAAADANPFQASFQGAFAITFAGCANGDDHLQFAGPGMATQAGSSVITGSSCLRHDPLRLGCSIIETDNTVLTAADGSTIHFANSGEDCLDPLTGQITGTASYLIVGGTDRFSGATGHGSVTVTALVKQLTLTGASGTFNPLSFSGSISA